MKMFRSTTINLPAETVWAEVQTAKLLQHVAWPPVRFIPISDITLEAFKPGGSYQVKLLLFGFLPFGTQWIVTSIHLPEQSIWPLKLRDDGRSNLIKKWDHWISIEPEGNGQTRYSDALEIKAGLLTPFVWAFAQLFYAHRQRRWRGLAQTLHARRLIDAEMEDFETARDQGEVAAAWQALERAHIISQPYLGPHLSNHMAMLGYARKQADWREVGGQIARLALAPIGALTGIIPIGNTGRSNVSAFQRMPISEELSRKIMRSD